MDERKYRSPEDYIHKGRKVSDILKDEKIDLEGAELERIDLSKTDLSGANLCDANLTGTRLWGANLTGTRLWGAKLAEADLSYANLTRVDLSYANLTGADLSNANLTGANLWDANLTGAYLLGANLTGARLWGAILAEADLSYANLTRVDLSYANLTGADLSNANLTGAHLTKANLTGAGLSDADLSGADLGANFSKTELDGVRYSRKGIYRGINLDGVHDNQRFVRFAKDQAYLEELKSGKWYDKAWYWMWNIFADCGRTPWLWILWSISLITWFAGGFLWLELNHPGSFHFEHLPWHSAWTHLYYSVVTFTTLGFGDMVPKTPWASLLVVLEVIFGYVMLGGLISILATKLARRS